MKRTVYILLVILGFFLSSSSFAQLAEPGGGDGSAPSDGGIAGGGAPIGSGLLVLIGLGAAYGSKNVFLLRSEDQTKD